MAQGTYVGDGIGNTPANVTIPADAEVAYLFVTGYFGAPSAVTVDGDACTQRGSTQIINFQRGQLWRIVSPTTGSVGNGILVLPGFPQRDRPIGLRRSRRSRQPPTRE